MNVPKSITEFRDGVPRPSLEQAAALHGFTCGTYQKRLRRQGVVLERAPGDHRTKLVPLSALSPPALSKWLQEQAAPKPALEISEAITPTGQADTQLQPLLPFRPPAETDSAAPPGLPSRDQKFLDECFDVLGQMMNHGWKKYEDDTVNGIRIKGPHDYVCALSRGLGSRFSISANYDRARVAREVLKDPMIPKGRKWAEITKRLLPKPRPGRSGHAYFTKAENAWQYPMLRKFYLNEAQLSVKRAHELLLEEIESRERAAGGTVIYQRASLRQCRTVLEKIPLTERVLGRQGEKVYNDRCAPYISRRPPEESGAIVCTDGKLLDILCRDTGWRLGRIWWVPFADVASERWLGHAFGPTISGDMVMDAAARMLEEACVPGAVQIDRGKEFQGMRFTGGYFKISGEKLFEEMEGLWQRLGVSVPSAIGRNPKTKPIERLFRSVREFEQSWSTYTGPNPQERPPQLALIEKQVQEFKAGKAPAPAVPTIEQVIAGLVWWCKERWSAQHRGRGKYRQGLTPDEAWNVKRPSGGHRTLSREEVDYYTSERRFVKVARGGQVNLTLYGQTLEYVAPELFSEQGKPVEVLRSRLNAGQVTVIYTVPGGTASCVAQIKDELPWGSESRREVAVRLRCINALKRTLKRGLATAAAASALLPEAPYFPSEALLGEMAEKHLVNARQLFGTSVGVPGRRRGPPKTLTSEAIARAALEVEESS